ncbi:putative tRNA modifying enzyme, MiaB-like [Nitrospira sp. KM1]|nr:putative tRNA modifying enzyme, MiaB-like [Nitrospira sp. KM1]
MVLTSRLRRDGYEVVDFGHPVDLLIINTCSVTEDAERTCRYAIRKTLRHSPHAFVAVTGCYAQTGVRELAAIPGIDLVIGNQYKWDVPNLLPPPDTLKKLPKARVLHTKTLGREDFIMPFYGEPSTTRALVKIQDGCNVMCSFCIIPFARGHERSRVLEDVYQEAEILAKGGFREIVLTGVNLGQYSHDGRDFLQLIDRLESIPQLERIRISSIEPATITKALIDRIAASTKVCPYLHVPLQSGDDSILSAMNRPYRLKEFTALVEYACSTIPGLGLGTDLMVGFPGESEAAFLNTYHVAETLPFSYFHVFPYSSRPGTAAVKLPGQVSPVVSSERVRALTALSNRKRAQFVQHHIGRTVSVLFESGERDGFRVGTAPNFLHVAVPSVQAPEGEVRPVLVSGTSDRWAVGQTNPESEMILSGESTL